jgi:N-terminal domain of reverse transcriptase
LTPKREVKAAIKWTRFWLFVLHPASFRVLALVWTAAKTIPKAPPRQGPERILPSASATSGEATHWKQINWPQCERKVRRLQARIVKATREGRWGKVQWLSIQTRPIHTIPLTDHLSN